MDDDEVDEDEEMETVEGCGGKMETLGATTSHSAHHHHHHHHLDPLSQEGLLWFNDGC